MIAKFPPPPNTSNLTDQVWRDWFYKLSVAMNRVWEVTNSPGILAASNGTFPMSGLGGELVDGDVVDSIPIIGPRGEAGIPGPMGPAYFFIQEDSEDNYIGPPWWS